jgi:hypothetical protein
MNNHPINLTLDLHTPNTTNHTMNTRSMTMVSNMHFCTTCNMYNCYHLNPVTPHLIHNDACACMMRNAGTYTK